MTHDVFISYSSRDKHIADAICHFLEENKIKCWIAPRNISAGEVYGNIIENAIKNCKVFIIVFSEFARISKWVNSELSVAFDEGKIIIPVRIDTAKADGNMRLILNDKHWIDIYSNVNSKFSEIKNAVLANLGQGQLVTKSQLLNAPSRSKRIKIFFMIISCFFVVFGMITVVSVWSKKNKIAHAQDIAESSLRIALKSSNADWGSVTLMEVSTGEIELMCNLTRGKDGNIRFDNNYSLLNNYEPGFVFGIVTLAALLEEGKMQLSDSVDCGNGISFIAGKYIRDLRPHGVISLKEVFLNHSNIGLAKLTCNLFDNNMDQLRAFFEKMGLNTALGNKITGMTRPYFSWIYPKRSIEYSFGYGIYISPLHILTIYNAIANDGQVVIPKLSTDSEELSNSDLSFTLSANTIKLLQECLTESGAAMGLNNVAAFKGISQVAGTGEGGYLTVNTLPDGSEEYVRTYGATIVGYFPADRPKYSLIVCIKGDERTKPQLYYDQIFKEIVTIIYGKSKVNIN